MPNKNLSQTFSQACEDLVNTYIATYAMVTIATVWRETLVK